MPPSGSTQPLPSRVCGPLCGLCGFSVAMLSGLINASDATSVMLRAIVSCLGCYGLGLAVGCIFDLIAQRVVERERTLHGVAEADPAAANQKTSS